MENHPYTPQVIDLLSKGELRTANELIGSAYCIRAVVVHGNHLGRSLGFPTANLELLKNNPFLPAHGVYAVKVTVDDHEYNGMANAGVRPTIDGKAMTVEVNLFDFSADLYGKSIEVSFIDRIRDERKFKDLDELVGQIHLDKQVALSLLS